MSLVIIKNETRIISIGVVKRHIKEAEVAMTSLYEMLTHCGEAIDESVDNSLACAVHTADSIKSGRQPVLIDNLEQELSTMRAIAEIVDETRDEIGEIYEVLERLNKFAI